MQTPLATVTSAKLEWGELIVAARAGDDVALAAMMSELHSYLLTVAEDQLGEKLRAKFGPSDIVQQSFVEAKQAIPKFSGSSEEEMRCWLKQIVLHNLVDSARRYTETQSRDVQREVSLDAGPEGGQLWDAVLCSNSETPSVFIRRAENDRQLMDAVDALPTGQRDVVVMRHGLGRSYQQIGAELGIAEDAARSRWMRAMQNLREQLNDGGQTQRRIDNGSP